MSNKTGGPAFPHTSHCTNGDFYEDHTGMTLRDYFAAKAMQTFLNDPVNIQGGETWADYLEDTAKSAYEMADAMIKARNAN